MKLYFLDKFGWPVERIKGRPVSNFIRLVLHTRKITTQRPKCLDPKPPRRESDFEYEHPTVYGDVLNKLD